MVRILLWCCWSPHFVCGSSLTTRNRRGWQKVPVGCHWQNSKWRTVSQCHQADHERGCVVLCDGSVVVENMSRNIIGTAYEYNFSWSCLKSIGCRLWRKKWQTWFAANFTIMRRVWSACRHVSQDFRCGRRDQWFQRANGFRHVTLVWWMLYRTLIPKNRGKKLFQVSKSMYRQRSRKGEIRWRTRAGSSHTPQLFICKTTCDVAKKQH